MLEIEELTLHKRPCLQHFAYNLYIPLWFPPQATNLSSLRDLENLQN